MIWAQNGNLLMRWSKVIAKPSPWTRPWTVWFRHEYQIPCDRKKQLRQLQTRMNKPWNQESRSAQSQWWIWGDSEPGEHVSRLRAWHSRANCQRNKVPSKILLSDDKRKFCQLFWGYNKVNISRWEQIPSTYSWEDAKITINFFWIIHLSTVFFTWKKVGMYMPVIKYTPTLSSSLTCAI
jgi:hypothetical protein